jgi:spoIIIJ-associated protein
MESESLDFTGRTVDEAIARATESLGRPKEDLEITVLSEGKGGILGIGAEDAHILVSVKSVTAAPVEVPPIDAAMGSAVEEHEERERAPITPELEQEARNILLDLLDLLGMDTDVEIGRRDGNLVLSVVGEDLGLLIGRRGETLTSLQFVLNLILAKRLKKWARVVVDVEGYRARREETLSGLAQRVATRVHQTGQPVALEAMPAGERRIIHLALADHPHVSTGSVGEGDHRKVVISPKR